MVRGPGLSDAISGTDPLKGNLPLQVHSADAGSRNVYMTTLPFEVAASMHMQHHCQLIWQRQTCGGLLHHACTAEAQGPNGSCNWRSALAFCLQVVKPLDDSPEAAHTAAVVNELSAEIQKRLADHPINQQRRAEGKNPANIVLLRGCGSRCEPRTF